MIRKGKSELFHQIVDSRPISPIRSPFKAMNPISPLRNPNLDRKIAMSPLRIRQNIMNSSNTPKKMISYKRAETDRQISTKEENSYMQSTLKNGMGLFQQLAFKNKLASEKKENNMASHNSKQMDNNGDKFRKEKMYLNQNTFGNVIKNVK